MTDQSDIDSHRSMLALLPGCITLVTMKISKSLSFFQFRIQTLLLLVVIAAILGAWWRDHQNQQLIIQKLINPGPRWDIDEVTGPPNTAGAGDVPTAWASQTPDGSREWIVVDYEKAVIPRMITIHETYNPGAVDRVSVFGSGGKEITVWRGVDPTPVTQPLGISKIPVNVEFNTKRVKVYINSPAVAGWNEIDAIGMIDNKGKKQWANKAYGSSAFGRNRTLPTR